MTKQLIDNNLGGWAASFAAILNRLAVAKVVPWSRYNTGHQRRQAEGIIHDVLFTTFSASAYPSVQNWQASQVIPTVSDMTVVMIGAAEEQPSFVLKIPRSAQGEQSLRQQVNMLNALHTDTRLAAWHHLIPTVLVEGDLDGQYFVLEQAMPGANARHLLHDPSTRVRVIQTASDTIYALHKATAVRISIDLDTLRRWLENPLQVLSTWDRARFGRPRYAAALARIGQEIRSSLHSQTLDVCLMHGDFWLPNLLSTTDGSVLTGILDWDEASMTGLPHLDLVHLILLYRCWSGHRQLGDVVVELLDGAPLAPFEREVIERNIESPALELRTLILLDWLNHIAANLSKSSPELIHRYWEVRNIDRVLRSV
jgi:aminoglycoside phosphotransferase (APT) family kinase protein